MARGAASREYTGRHCYQFTTHSLTLNLADGSFFQHEEAARRIYVGSAGSATIVVRTPFSGNTATSTMVIGTGETLDCSVEKILPASNFTRITVYW